MDQGNFKYEPITSSAEIRLLKILPKALDDTVRCSIYDAKLSDKHYCLSYCWNPFPDRTPNPQPRAIILNDHAFQVSKNLWEFLNCARLTDMRDAIWIDAICIDQNHVEEKNQQVKLMGLIYSSATFVLVWLDLSEPEDGEALARFGSYIQLDELSVQHGTGQTCVEDCLWAQIKECFRVRPGAPMARPRVREAQKCEIHENIQSLMNHPVLRKIHTAQYWTRVWVMQELNLAQNIQILTTTGHFDFQKILPMLEAHHQYYSAAKSHGLGKGVNSDHIFPITFRGQSRSTDICGALSLTWMKTCFDWHDRLYAILSLVPSWKSSFPVDYSSDLGSFLWQLVDFHANRTYHEAGISLLDTFTETGRILSLFLYQVLPQIKETYVGTSHSTILEFSRPMRDEGCAEDGVRQMSFSPFSTILQSTPSSVPYCCWTLVDHQHHITRPESCEMPAKLPRHRHLGFCATIEHRGDSLMLVWMMAEHIASFAWIHDSHTSRIMNRPAIYIRQQDEWLLLHPPSSACEFLEHYVGSHESVESKISDLAIHSALLLDQEQEEARTQRERSFSTQDFDNECSRYYGAWYYKFLSDANVRELKRLEYETNRINGPSDDDEDSDLEQFLEALPTRSEAKNQASTSAHQKLDHKRTEIRPIVSHAMQAKMIEAETRAQSLFDRQSGDESCFSDAQQKALAAIGCDLDDLFDDNRLDKLERIRLEQVRGNVSLLADMQSLVDECDAYEARYGTQERAGSKEQEHI